MHYRGKLSVLSALHDGEPVLVVVLGGGMASVVSLGMLSALSRARLTNFKAGVGISGGACNLAAFYSSPHGMDDVLSVYEHLALGGFLTWRMGIFGPYLSFNIEELVATLQGERTHLGLPSLDKGAIEAHASQLWFGVTRHTTGEGVLLDAKQNLFSALRASMAIQGVCEPEVIDGEALSDGAVGMRVGMAIRKVWARKVLVLMNRMPFHDRTWWEQWFTPYVTRIALLGLAPGLCNNAVRMEESFAEEIRRIENCKRLEMLCIAPDWTDPPLMPWTTSCLSLQTAYVRAQDFTESLCEKARTW